MLIKVVEAHGEGGRAAVSQLLHLFEIPAQSSVWSTKAVLLLGVCRVRAQLVRFVGVFSDEKAAGEKLAWRKGGLNGIMAGGGGGGGGGEMLHSFHTTAP